MLDKDQVKKRFEANIADYEAAASVQKSVCNKLSLMIQAHVTKNPKSILEIGCGTGMLTKKLLEAYNPVSYYANDISNSVEPYIRRIFENIEDVDLKFIFDDAEILSAPEGCEMVVSSSAIQWFDDFASYARRLSDSLGKGGVFAFSTYGVENYKEIRHLGAGLAYYAMEELIDCLSTDFEIIKKSEETITLTFDNQVALLKHVKKTGATGNGSHKLYKDIRAYLGQSVNGPIELTYHPMCVLAERK